MITNNDNTPTAMDNPAYEYDDDGNVISVAYGCSLWSDVDMTNCVEQFPPVACKEWSGDIDMINRVAMLKIIEDSKDDDNGT